MRILRLRVDGDGSLASVYDQNLRARNLGRPRKSDLVIYGYSSAVRRLGISTSLILMRVLEVVAEREPEIVEQGPLRAALRVVSSP